MDQEIIQKYLSEVPLEIRYAVKPLSNEKAWALLIALMKEGDMRYKEIKERFNADSSGDIDRILKSLVLAGLVSKKEQNIKELVDNNRSPYYATELSSEIIMGLSKAILHKNIFRDSNLRESSAKYNLMSDRYENRMANREINRYEQSSRSFCDGINAIGYPGFNKPVGSSTNPIKGR